MFANSVEMGPLTLEKDFYFSEIINIVTSFVLSPHVVHYWINFNPLLVYSLIQIHPVVLEKNFFK